MSERLGLQHLGLKANGPTLTLSIGAGQSVAIMGPAGAGKSFLLRVMAGQERPAAGSVTRTQDFGYAPTGTLNRRSKPATLARGRGVHAAARATELLIAARLWETRNESISTLSPGQISAAELLEPLSERPPLVLLDDQLDRMDPWSRSSMVRFLGELRSAGSAVVAVTNRTDIASWFDAIIVLNGFEVRFAGSREELLRQGPPHTVTVETTNQPTVRALVDPFEVRIEEQPDGLLMRSAQGQELAARLLVTGYGDVNAIMVRPPTLEDALLSLMS